ncbi:MAG TPA: hypothetical protein VIM61_04205 [Chthoniobacterales bacterium]
MGSIKGVSVVLGIFLASHAFGDDRPVSPRKTLEEIKAELKPLRERAALEPEVVAARKSLDEAYRAYWESVRVAMVRLEPEKKTLIEKEIRLRKQLNSVRGEASPSPTPAGSKP